MTSLRDDSRSGALATLLDALATPRTLTELQAVVPAAVADDVSALVESLLEDGLVVPAGRTRADDYAAFMWHGPIDPDGVIAILGDGVVADRVAGDLGSMGCSIRRTGDAHDDIVGALDGAGLAIAVADGLSPGHFFSVDAAARQSGTNWLPAYLEGSHGFVGPWIRPAVGPCFREVTTQLEATAVKYAEYLAVRDHAPPHEETIVAAPHASIIGGWAAAAALAAYGGAVPPLVGRIMIVDFERMGIDIAEAMRLPRCPVCDPQLPATVYG